MSEEEKQAIIHLLDKQARYEYAINNDLSFNDEDYEAYIIRQSMINKDKEIERLNRENEKLKNGLNKLLQLNNYMVNSSSGKVIDKLIVKQRDLIYELLEGRPRGIMFGSKGVDKE